MPVSLEGSGHVPAEGGQLPALPTAPPRAGAVPVPAAVWRDGRAVCRWGSGSRFCWGGQKAAEVVEHPKLLTLQCQGSPRAGYGLGIMQVLESKLSRRSAFGQTWVFIHGSLSSDLPVVVLWPYASTGTAAPCQRNLRPSKVCILNPGLEWRNAIPMETVANIRKRGMRGREKKWLNLSCDHLIEVYSYGMLPGCLSYKACACGHHGAEPRDTKAEDGAGSARQARVLRGWGTEESALRCCRASKEISGQTDAMRENETSLHG